MKPTEQIARECVSKIEDGSFDWNVNTACLRFRGDKALPFVLAAITDAVAVATVAAVAQQQVNAASTIEAQRVTHEREVKAFDEGIARLKAELADEQLVTQRDGLKAERDALRAEVERLKLQTFDVQAVEAERDGLEDENEELATERDGLLAEVERLAKVCGINKTDSEHIITSQRENLVKLRAELALATAIIVQWEKVVSTSDEQIASGEFAPRAMLNANVLGRARQFLGKEATP